MTKRAVLVLVDDDARPGKTVPAPSCATCRWVVPSTQEDIDGYNDGDEQFRTHSLACRFHETFWSGMYWDRPANAPVPGMIGWCEGGPRGTIIVRPDFGCVQWEAK